MPNKMTDDEIIEILEICVNKTETFVINRNANTLDYDKVTIKDILGVINRQKDKIEFLEEKLDNLEYEFDLMREEKQVIEKRAVKEFAERLKKKFSWQYTTALWKPLCETVENLLKEMVGENDGKG